MRIALLVVVLLAYDGFSGSVALGVDPKSPADEVRTVMWTVVGGVMWVAGCLLAIAGLSWVVGRLLKKLRPRDSGDD
jgi:hypothetical protein